MSKHEFIPDAPSPSGEAAIPLTSELSATPKMALAGADTAKTDTAKTDTAKAEAVSASLPEAAPAETATRTVGHKIDLAGVDAPGIAPDMPDTEEVKPAFCKEAAERDDALPDSADETPHISRFTLLAAALALAAALGAMIGALAAYGLARPANIAVAGRPGLEEVQALKENVVQARVELAALKLSIDSANRNAAAQLTRISERIDRVERTQAEPAAKLAKAVDALERLSRGEAAPKDVTGSVLPPPAAVNQASKSGAIDGWVVRDVHRGTALIEGRMGLIEVDQGDVVPGLGRVDAIRRQDGRWVVVTSKGLIMPPR